MMEVAEIEQRLRDQVAALAPHLLPNGVRDGHYLKVGSIEGERGQSLVVELSGARQGKWRDYAADSNGDMLDLIEATQGLADKRSAVQWAKDWLGIEEEYSPDRPARLSPEEREARARVARERAARHEAELERERAAKMKGARSLYLHAEAETARTPVDFYLRARMLRPDPFDRWPGVLRYHPEVFCKEARVKVPAMVAAIYLADGTHVATHRTFLANHPEKGWGKMDVTQPKKVLGPMGGGFIPISKGSSGKPMSQMVEGEPVYMTEGIEDAIAVRMKMPEARIVAAISLGNMGAVILPEKARRLTIVTDRDDGNETAQEALERSIGRQQARGIEVSLVVPPEKVNGLPVKDINDWIRAEAWGARAKAARGA
ncbi:DUF7146 domain-containing protein [Croceicoccus mobilis]|uniref:Toprim domain-containing protein n=1 Tax=Croceicoccus mobilis TaxID=1703339 RepID=A0A916Z352_9SPHN|nr:toprim domain-containing protein [Croceicoccus mobilis]GGD74031.1 hypothetical protein GCM10010990_24570 [Croceicoccus mobilis]